MRLRLHFDDHVRGHLWTDEDGVVQADPPKLREEFDSTKVTYWPEHPGRIITIDEGEVWLHGMLWMTQAARLGGGRTWLAIVGGTEPFQLPPGVTRAAFTDGSDGPVTVFPPR